MVVFQYTGKERFLPELDIVYIGQQSVSCVCNLNVALKCIICHVDVAIHKTAKCIDKTYDNDCNHIEDEKSDLPI